MYFSKTITSNSMQKTGCVKYITNNIFVKLISTIQINFTVLFVITIMLYALDKMFNLVTSLNSFL